LSSGWTTNGDVQRRSENVVCHAIARELQATRQKNLEAHDPLWLCKVAATRGGDVNRRPSREGAFTVACPGWPPECCRPLASHAARAARASTTGCVGRHAACDSDTAPRVPRSLVGRVSTARARGNLAARGGVPGSPSSMVPPFRRRTGVARYAVDGSCGPTPQVRDTLPVASTSNSGPWGRPKGAERFGGSPCGGSAFADSIGIHLASPT
jgi:hypothetical protein